MAITYFGAGTAANGTTSAAPSYPGSMPGGQYLVLVAASKYAYPSTPSGWTLLGQASGGAGANGLDSGTAYVSVFGKLSSGADTGTVTVSVAGGNAIRARIFGYTAPLVGVWGVAASVGSDNTAGTAWSVTGDVDPGVTSGDVVFAGSAVNSDAQTFSAQAVASTGVTYGAASEREDTGTTSGDDLRLVCSDHPASSGTSSAAPVYTMTANGTSGNQPAGATVMVRLREPTVGVSVLTSGSGLSASSFTTASVTLTAGRKYYFAINDGIAAATAATPTVTGWSLVADIGIDTTPSGNHNTWLYKAGDGSTGTHTIDLGGVVHDVCGWAIMELVGFDTVTNASEFASTTDGGADSNPIAVTYGSAFASASNFGMAAANITDQRTATPRSGWSMVANILDSGFLNAYVVIVKTSSDTIASVSWDFGNFDSIIAFELPITSGYSATDPLGAMGLFGV